MTRTEDAWYSELRRAWQPPAVRVLLIGESAPDDHGDPANRRFFYSDQLTGKDNLFRAVAEAVLGVSKLSSRTFTSKRAYLEQLRDRGLFLIDLVPYPVNAASPASRLRALRDNVGGCVARVAALQPQGVIVCHSPSFAVLQAPLRAAALPLLHDEPIPFPLGNWRTAFVDKMRTALARLDNDPG